MLDLMPHQKDALKKLTNGSILWGGTGSGKGRVAVAYYLEHETPKNVIVITTAKKRDSLDWEGEFARAGVSPYEDSTLHGILNVDSWNNIEKWQEMRNCFFIFDEQRLVGSGSWVKAFLRIARHNRWIMLSATPGDTWLDYVPVFCANGFYKNRTAFKREHVVYAPYVKFPKVDRYLGVQKLEKLRDQILVHMPYTRETIRRQKTIWVPHDHEVLMNAVRDRWNFYENRPVRDITELFLLMRRIVNTDESRIKAVRDVLREHQRLIIFYNFNYELEILRSLEIETAATVAEWNGHKHEAIPDTDSFAYLVQYTAGSEAWETTETDTILFYSLTYSYKMWEQAHGRIDRINTPFQNLYYYVLRSKSAVDTAIWRSLKAKKNFQPRTYTDLTVESEVKNVDLAA